MLVLVHLSGEDWAVVLVVIWMVRFVIVVVVHQDQ